LAVATHLLRDPWEYQDVFWALRISTTEVQHMQPAELVQAIHDSYPNQRVRAVLYLLKIDRPIDCSSTQPHQAQGATNPAKRLLLQIIAKASDEQVESVLHQAVGDKVFSEFMAKVSTCRVYLPLPLHYIGRGIPKHASETKTWRAGT
jgi:hypothetical protein